MGMLAFFPWLRRDEPIRLGSFHLFLYAPGQPLPEGVESLVSPNDLRRLLSPYRVHVQNRLGLVCLLQYGGKPIGTPLQDEERAEIFAVARHLAVVGLATRRFDGSPLGSYSASGHYQVIIQAFPEPFSGSATVTHRRKDGTTRLLISANAHVFNIPEHLIHKARPELDMRLLGALARLRVEVGDELRAHYDASITQFLMANSDSPDVPLDAESISTYAAIERVVNAEQSLKSFRAKVRQALGVVDDVPVSSRFRDELGGKAQNVEGPVLREWLRHLYMLRGNAGHGHSVEKVSSSWSQQDHLMAGAFVYPLALKCCLHRQGLYALSGQDCADIVGLEQLLDDRPFFAARGDPDESELDVRARCGWLRQMQAIGAGLASIELSRTIEAAVRPHMLDDEPG